MKYLWRHLVADALYSSSSQEAESGPKIESNEQKTPSLVQWKESDYFT